MTCSDPTCEKTATRELLGVAMCEAYYIEALEHSAHIVAVDYLAELSEASRINLVRCEKISETIERKRIEQEKSPEAQPNESA